MLKIKLVRTGKRNAPAFRIMAGSEILGSFNPSLNAPKRFVLDKARFEYWLKQGAKVSGTMEKLVKDKYEFKPYVRTGSETPEQPSEGKTNEGTT